MKILAVDPGFERVGIAIIENPSVGSGQERLLYSDCFRTSAKDEFSKRLLAIGEGVKHVIEKYKPNLLAIETAFLCFIFDHLLCPDIPKSKEQSDYTF